MKKQPTKKKEPTNGKGALGRPRGHVAVEDRLDEILTTATKLFRQQGFRGTRLDDIAEQLGVTRAALYYYFDGKEQILELICIRAMEAGEEALRVSGSLDQPPDRLRDFAHRFAGIMTSDQARVYFRERPELRPAVRADLMKRTRALTRSARSIVAEGVESGVFRRDVDQELAAVGLLSMINSMSQWYQPSGRFSADEIVDTYLDIYFDGLFVKPAR